MIDTKLKREIKEVLDRMEDPYISYSELKPREPYDPKFEDIFGFEEIPALKFEDIFGFEEIPAGPNGTSKTGLQSVIEQLKRAGVNPRKYL